MRFLLKLLAAPVVLALTLFVWLCMGVLYLSSLVLGVISTIVGLLGLAVLVTYSVKMVSSTCNCLSGQPDGPANGRCLAGGQGAEPAVCDPGRGVRLNRKRRIAGSECPAIFLTLLSC